MSASLAFSLHSEAQVLKASWLGQQQVNPRTDSDPGSGRSGWLTDGRVQPNELE